MEHALAVDAAAVVADADQDAAGIVAGSDLERASCRFACGEALLAGLDAMIHRVANQMHQRVGDALDHRLVEFGLGTCNLEMNLLAEFGSQVMDHAPESPEGLADLHHAHLQRAVADFFDQATELVARFDQLRIADLLREQPGAGAGNHEFAQQIDDVVEPVGPHAHIAGIVALTAFAAGALIGALICASIDRQAGGARQVDGGAADRSGGDRSDLIRQVVLDVALGQCRQWAMPGGGAIVGDRGHADLAVFAHHLESRFDVGRRARSAQHQAEIEMAVFGVEGIEGGQAIGAQTDRLDRAQRAEIVEDAQRIESVAKGVDLVVQRDPMCAGRRRSGVAACIAVVMGRAALLGDCWQCGHQGGDQGVALIFDVGRSVGGALARIDQRDQAPDLVAALQQHGAGLCAQMRLAFAQCIEKGLYMVGEGNDLVEPEQTRRPLDGVGAAKERIEQLAVGRAVFEFEQQLLELVEELDRFADESGQRIAQEVFIVVRKNAHGAVLMRLAPSVRCRAARRRRAGR